MYVCKSCQTEYVHTPASGQNTLVKFNVNINALNDYENHCNVKSKFSHKAVVCQTRY